jgi:altronate dehydratase small subunit
MDKKAIVIDPRDNVATALADLEAGEIVEVEVAGERQRVELCAPIRFGHKFALAPLGAGAAAIKYGAPIGTTTRPIAAGEHVHVHNLESRRGRGDLG